MTRRRWTPTQAFYFSQHVFTQFEHRLRHGTTLGKAGNFVLWLGYYGFRPFARIVRQLRLRRQEKRSEASGETIHHVLAAPLTAASTASKGTRVLIIAELSIPQCRRYRVQQKVEMLRRLGRGSTVLSWTNAAACRSALQTHSLVIFYRTPATPEVIRLFEEARRLGVTTLYDIDDLVFDREEYTKNSNVQRLDPEERAQLLEGARLYCEALKLADHAIASTSVLRDYMTKFNAGTIFVVENGLDDTALTAASRTTLSPPERTPETVVIGYGSGTRTHDADFQVAAPALARLLDDEPHVRLVIQGELTLPEELERHESRITHISFLDAADYLDSLRLLSINLAPLEPTTFNDAKSNIKFLEAALLGIPTVASPASEFTKAIKSGENGLLASSSNEWYDALRRLVRNPKLRRDMGAKARQTALEHYHPENLARRQMAPIVALSSPPQPDGLKVLVVNVLYSPIAFGGGTIITQLLAESLAKQGASVTVFCGSHEVPATDEYGLHRYEVNGVPVIAVRFPGVRDATLQYKNERMKVAFDEVLATVQPDIVHFHCVQDISASILESCIEAEIPYVVTAHDAWWLCERQFMIRGDGTFCNQKAIDLHVCATCTPEARFTHRRYNYLTRLLTQAERVLVPSEYQRQLYVASGLSPELVTVNKNGILVPATPPAKLQGERIRLAYLGGKAHHKGYYWLQQILARVPEENYTLLLVDIHQRFGAQEIFAKEWPVAGRVEICPPFDQTEIDVFFASVDVLLFPSQWRESFGLTVREAMARNVWVISTDSGGVTEDIIEGENGNVVAMDDIDGFAQAIRRALKNRERIRRYQNPYRSSIRTLEEQARELYVILQTHGQHHELRRDPEQGSSVRSVRSASSDRGAVALQRDHR